MTNLIDLADKLRDYCTKYSHKLNIIPRTSCVRVLSDIVIDPLIDLTLYISDDFDLDNDSKIQIRLMDGLNDKGEKSYNDICKYLDKLIRVEEIR